MTNAEKVDNFLDEAKVFYFLTTDGDQPVGRPFSFHLLDDGKIYFGCGTFKNVYAQLLKNPKVEILAAKPGEFLRYDGIVKFVEDERLLKRTREVLPQVMAIYDKNNYTMALFYLENGHAEIHTTFECKEKFDV